MPEYLAPGVYVEETSYRSKSMEGVSTSTAAFIGPTRWGPLRGTPEVLTSYADFERLYGGLEQLNYDGEMTNYLAQSVRAFFNEGGSRVYIARVFEPKDGDAQKGVGYAKLISGEDENTSLELLARYPGAAGNLRVTFNLKAGLNILATQGSSTVLRGVNNYDLVWVRPKDAETKEGEEPAAQESPSLAEQLFFVEVTRDGDQVFTSLTGGTAPTYTTETHTVHIVTINVAVSFDVPGAKGAPAQAFTDLSFHPRHTNGLSTYFAENPSNKATELYVPLIVRAPKDAYKCLTETILTQTDASGRTVMDQWTAWKPENGDLSVNFVAKLTGGNDGVRPTAKAYDGDAGAAHGGRKSGFALLEDIDDIAIVAAPGSTYGGAGSYKSDCDTITRALITHCTQMRYRVAILDTPNDQLISQVREYRSQLDSTHAALYYPWIRVLDPVTSSEINLPPSGFVAGIWARNDVENGVHKAPANEVVRSALGLQVMLNKGQQDVLNPEGINCFRFFEGRGIRLWGARTISSDSEWKYVNVRRYFAYLEHTIDKGTQWVVFQSNGQPLWDKVTATISDFLFNEWKSERLLGSSPAEAYFVRCDRTTMTQNDLDNGRLVCHVGVSPLKPAEFVVFRIGQWTATS